MAKKKGSTGLEPKLETRIEAVRKLMNSFPESLYINNGFYTNKNVYIKDSELSNIPSEFKVLKDGYKKILNVQELENKFLPDFKNKKYMIRKMDKTEFNKFYADIKRFGFEQIKIRNGKFVLYDDIGQPKWKMVGETEALKNFHLDFDFSLFLKIIEVIKKLNPLELTFYSNTTYLVIKLVAGGSITIYARGVILAQEEIQQKLL